VATVDAVDDTLQSGAQHEVPLTVDASGADIGQYEETFTILSNDPEARSTAVSVAVTVAASDPLPVEMAAFDVALDGPTTARLSWQTASETNNAGFAVQHRGPEASEFVQRGFVEGQGTTTQPHTYRFRVSNLAPGPHVFRLRQIDTDGTASLSETAAIQVEAPRVLALRLVGNNPVRTETSVAFTVPKTGPATVGLYNVLGQRVRMLFDGTVEAGNERTVRISASRLPSGIYFVRLLAGGRVRTQQIAVVR
jgi:hypothetical protein